MSGLVEILKNFGKFEFGLNEINRLWSMSLHEWQELPMQSLYDIGSLAVKGMAFIGETSLLRNIETAKILSKVSEIPASEYGHMSNMSPNLDAISNGLYDFTILYTLACLAFFEGSKVAAELITRIPNYQNKNNQI